MKRFLWLVVLCLVVATADAQIDAEVFEPEMYVSPTEYDYTNVALFLTKNSKTKREKARAIYDWICENIAYDEDICNLSIKATSLRGVQRRGNPHLQVYKTNGSFLNFR